MCSKQTLVKVFIEDGTTFILSNYAYENQKLKDDIIFVSETYSPVEFWVDLEKIISLKGFYIPLER